MQRAQRVQWLPRCSGCGGAEVQRVQTCSTYCSAPMSSSVSASSAAPPASTSSRQASPTRGLALVPEKASEPPDWGRSSRDRGESDGRSMEVGRMEVRLARSSRSGEIAPHCCATLSSDAGQRRRAHARTAGSISRALASASASSASKSCRPRGDCAGDRRERVQELGSGIEGAVRTETGGDRRRSSTPGGEARRLRGAAPPAAPAVRCLPPPPRGSRSSAPAPPPPRARPRASA